MTIIPLITPYNGDTHANLVNIHLAESPAVAHFRLGRFVLPEGEIPPAMPYNDVVPPAGWSERNELNTANLNAGVASLTDVVVAIDANLQANA